MSLNTVLTILIITTTIGGYFLGMEVYRRSMRVRRRLQMGQIFTNITHELLTPLTVLSASVDHLREQSPEYESDYDLMQLNIQRMVRLLQQILETSKSQAGELKLLVSNGDVMKYIHETARCLEPLMTKNQLSFTIDCHPESMMGWIDTDKLDKIIYNLLSNAAKYTSKGGEVKLQVSTNRTYDKVTIQVSDTGSGISKERLKHLFERFYDGDYRRHNTIGHGLGLALTRDLVYLHHGKISCESEVGKGSIFTVTIPIVKEAFTPEQIDEQAQINVDIPRDAIMDINAEIPGLNENLEQTEPDDNSYRLLIVEDNLELLMLMHHLMGQYYKVYVAKNGQEALDIVHKSSLDLIISDITMPGMDGIQLTKAVKGDPNYSHLPVILLTAKTQNEDKEEALKAGADEYLTKPFRLGDLKIRIDNIITNRKRIQQDFSQQELEQTRKKIEEAPQTPENEFLKRALTCIHEHLDDSDYDRDAFAADMGASSSTLYNKLRSITGMNVSTFIRDVRLKEAYKIAKDNPTLRVSDLAYRVGFQDPKYFSSCFKKQFGILPKEFMDSLTNTSRTAN